MNSSASTNVYCYFCLEKLDRIDSSLFRHPRGSSTFFQGICYHTNEKQVSKSIAIPYMYYPYFEIVPKEIEIFYTYRFSGVLRQADLLDFKYEK